VKLILSILIVLCTSACFGQQRNITYLKNSGKLVDLVDSADYIRIISAPDSGDVLYNVVELYPTHVKKLIGKSSSIEEMHLEGVVNTFFKDGTRQSNISYINGKPVGSSYEYYPSGKLYRVLHFVPADSSANPRIIDARITAVYDSVGNRLVTDGTGYIKIYDEKFENVIEEGPLKNSFRDSIWHGIANDAGYSYVETYRNGILIDGKSTEADGKEYHYVTEVRTAPRFPGGDRAFVNFLVRNIHYPEASKKNNVQGRVILTFLIEKDGRLTDIKVVRSLDQFTDKEALRVLALSPPWEPGIERGRPVRVKFSIPVNFTIW
jgi:TonB family protein